MPVTNGAEPHCYASYSPSRKTPASSTSDRSGKLNSSWVAVNYERDSLYRNDYRTSRERAEPSPEQRRGQPSGPPKRSPSIFRRINEAMKSKSSPSTQEAASKAAQVDPMYAAPEMAGSSRSSMPPTNPISRFRRNKILEKELRMKREREPERDSPSPRHSGRGDERMGRSISGSALSRSRSDARVYRVSDKRQQIYQGTREPSRHARTTSEVTRDEGRTRRAPLTRAQTSEPIPDASSVSGPPPVGNAIIPSTRNAGYIRNYQHSPPERLPREKPDQRAYTQVTQSNQTGSQPSRMGRYGIYASPVQPPVQVQHSTQTDRTSNRTAHTVDRSISMSPIRRVEGWEVQISPPATPYSQSTAPTASKCGLFRRRPTQTRAPSQSSNSASLTLVSEHPLMDRPLPTPPDPPEREKAEEFARNLTQRMSVLLSLDDVDFSSRSALAALPEAEDAECSNSPGSSGTATPTGPSTTQVLAQETIEQPDASSASESTSNPEPSSPFGTFLANAREMNDAFVRGTGSIWDKLFGNKGKDNGEKSSGTNDQAYAPVSSAAAVISQKGNGTEASKPAPPSEEANNDLEGSHDIMLYSPLVPDADSVVEIAASEVVTLYGDGADEARESAYRAELRRRWADGRGFISLDALSRSTVEPVQEEACETNDSGAPAEGEQTTVVSVDAVRPNQESGTMQETSVPRPREKVIWKPSPTQISVQVLWWGYRIYLPPPVLHVLNSRTIETAKRAALLTSALTWLLENLPLGSLPAAFAPAALLLKALVPLLGMIGSFVAWSWKATVTFDRGNGVVLSATWVLPIVLIPGTWEDGEWPRPPPPPVPTSTPPGTNAVQAAGIETI